MKIYRISKYILVYLLVRGHWNLMVRVGADEESDGGTGSTSADAGLTAGGAAGDTHLAVTADPEGSSSGTHAGSTSPDASGEGAGADGSGTDADASAGSPADGTSTGDASADPSLTVSTGADGSVASSENGSGSDAAPASREASEAASSGETDGTGSSGEEDQASSGTGQVAEAPHKGSGTSAEGDSGSSSGQTSEGAGSADSGSAEGSVAVPAEGASSGGASTDGADASMTVSTDADGSVASSTEGSGVAVTVEGDSTSAEPGEGSSDSDGSVSLPERAGSNADGTSSGEVSNELSAKKEEAKRLAEEARKAAEQLLKQAENLTKALDETSEIQDLVNMVESTDYNIKIVQSNLKESSEHPDMMYYTGFPDGWHRYDAGADDLIAREDNWANSITYYSGFPDGWHFGDPLMLRELRRHELSREIEAYKIMKDLNLDCIAYRRKMISRNQDKKKELLKQIEDLEYKCRGFEAEINYYEEQNKQLDLVRACLIQDVYALRYTEQELAERIKEKQASQTVLKLFKDDNDGNKVELTSGVEYELKQVSGDDRFEIKDGVMCTLIKLGDHELWKKGERELQEPNVVAFNQNAGVVGVLDDNTAVIYKKDTNSGLFSFHNSAPRQKGSGSDATAAELEPGKAPGEPAQTSLAVPSEETPEAKAADAGDGEAKEAGEGATEKSDPSEPKPAEAAPATEDIVSPDASLTLASEETSGVNEVDASDAKAEVTEADSAEPHVTSSPVASTETQVASDSAAAVPEPTTEDKTPEASETKSESADSSETKVAEPAPAAEPARGEAASSHAATPVQPAEGAAPPAEGTQAVPPAVRLFKSDANGAEVEMVVETDFTKKHASGDDRYEFKDNVKCVKVMFGEQDVWKKGEQNVDEPKFVGFNDTVKAIVVRDNDKNVVYKKEDNSDKWKYIRTVEKQPKGSGASKTAAHSGTSASSSPPPGSSESTPEPGSLSTGLSGSKSNLASTPSGSGETDDTSSATSGEGCEHNENESGSSTALRGSNEGSSEGSSSADGSAGESQDRTC